MSEKQGARRRVRGTKRPAPTDTAPPTPARGVDGPAQWGVLAVSAVTILHAWSLRWVAEDAWISLRYARHLVAGHGLVFNVGERVEGYTNFLWTVLLAVGLFVGAPPRALVIALGLASTAAAMVALGAVWRRVVPRDAVVPVALLAAGVNYSYAAFATSGLEGSLLGALLAAAFAVAPLDRSPGESDPLRSAALAGLLTVLAVMTRPDAALALGVLGVALALDASHRSRRAAVLGAFVAPLVLLYVPYFALRWRYYGLPLPNTFYAKSGDVAAWSQGYAYVAQFAGRYFLAPMALVLVARAVVGLVRRERPTARVAALTAYVVVHTLYVMRVGGDFMEGRFLVTVLPMYLLLVEASLRTLPLPRELVWSAFGAVVFVSGANLGRLPAGSIVNGLSDERSWEPMFEQWQREGAALGRHLPPGTVIATDSVGAFGYAAGLPIIDTLGLTDAVVARTPRAADRRAGHQHLATMEYLRQRRVALLRDGLGYYPIHRAPDRVSAGHRYVLLSDDPAVVSGFFAAMREVPP